MHALFVYITASGREEAERIGAALVEARLAACANVIAPMHSLYWWQGAIEKDAEAVLVAKSASDRFDALVEKVKELHSYDCPCVVAMPIVAGHADYLAWIEAETRPDQGDRTR